MKAKFLKYAKYDFKKGLYEEKKCEVLRENDEKIVILKEGNKTPVYIPKENLNLVFFKENNFSYWCDIYCDVNFKPNESIYRCCIQILYADLFE